MPYTKTLKAINHAKMVAYGFSAIEISVKIVENGVFDYTPQNIVTVLFCMICFAC